MLIDPIRVHNQNKLVADYRMSSPEIMEFFDYHPLNDFKQRMKELKERSFYRKELIEVLNQLNEEWEAPKATFRNIERLADENSVVVIAGQQAGLLTGPLYTINKIISVIQLAKQQELKLQAPVIPVFWIAGEDHDFDEINHIFLPDKSRMKKFKISQRAIEKSSVSDIDIDEKEMVKWMDQVFSQIGETNYTKDLYNSIRSCLNQSKTYTDFFARLIFQLFPDEGLVLMDSHHQAVRVLERDYFVQIIEKQPKISVGVSQAINQLKNNGYVVPLDVDESGGHLFYHKEKERILLFRNDDGDWVGKQNEVTLTTEELLQIATSNPEKLSNNVVTRPLMQELLFPSLAFVAGPGEISYWSALKPVFEAFDIKMPPVSPRLSFTFVEHKVGKALDYFNLTVDKVLNNGLESFKKDWIASKTEPNVHELANQMKETIEKAHEPLRSLAKEIRSDIGDLADKNLMYLHKDISFLEDRIMKAVEEKYRRELKELDLIQLSLFPGGYQERVWNPIPLLNKYGTRFLKETTNQNCSFLNEHYLVYL